MVRKKTNWALWVIISLSMVFLCIFLYQNSSDNSIMGDLNDSINDSTEGDDYIGGGGGGGSTPTNNYPQFEVNLSIGE